MERIIFKFIIIKRTTRKNGKPIRCNRPNWRKQVIEREGMIRFRKKGKKIKSKKWIKIDIKK